MNTTTKRIEKIWGERTISENSEGYLTMSVPPEAASEDEIDIEPGSSVRVKAVIEESGSYIKLDPVE